MKKRWLRLLLTALMLALLCACAGERGDPNVYDVEYEGRTYHVDLIEKTISYADVVCRFELSQSKFRVEYPDGSSWFQETDNGFGYHGGWSDDYDESRYVPGNTLWEVLSRRSDLDDSGRRSERMGHMLLGLILIALGAVNAVKPEISWQIRHGWHYKNAEPSDLSLGLGRLCGVAVIIIGMICMFV